MYTPFKVPKGPPRDARLGSVRVTKGTFVDGEDFVIHDHWGSVDAAHRDLGKPWRGTTCFVDISECEGEEHKVNNKLVTNPRKKERLPIRAKDGRSIWAEMVKFVDSWADA